ncbi:MAG: 16S rRNA (uracil(1498)-N(3))-methyltransferase [Rikenellaceae bacterium]
MQLFYAPEITTPEYTLSEEESKHAIRVLRLTKGDIIHITDGRGSIFSCRIIDENVKRCRVETESIQSEYERMPYSLVMGVAPTKSIERFEWFLEKATEVGISEIYPLLTTHSERKAIKHERQQRVITSACKQSLKAYHPILHEMTALSELVHSDFDGEKLIAHCNEPRSSEGKRLIKDLIKPESNTLVLIGPEGDFSPEEVDLALCNGFKEISLGTQRLRSETAAVVVAIVASTINQ